MLKNIFANRGTKASDQTANQVTRTNGRDRFVLSGGAIAYIEHDERSLRDVRLSVHNLVFQHTDRNTSEDWCEAQIMSEKPDSKGLSDFDYAAERLRDKMETPGAAKIFVFYDHKDHKLGSADDILKEIRDRFPSPLAAGDEYSAPPLPRKTQDAPARPSTNWRDYGLCG